MAHHHQPSLLLAPDGIFTDTSPRRSNRRFSLGPQDAEPIEVPPEGGQFRRPGMLNPCSCFGYTRTSVREVIDPSGPTGLAYVHEVRRFASPDVLPSGMP